MLSRHWFGYTCIWYVCNISIQVNSDLHYHWKKSSWLKQSLLILKYNSKFGEMKLTLFSAWFHYKAFQHFCCNPVLQVFFITNRATFRDFRSIFIESRTAGILAFVLTGLNELLTSRCPKSTIRTFKESERCGTSITGALMETLMETRGDFSANWAMATFALSVTASDASRTFPLAASIWLSSSSTWKPFRYSCLERKQSFKFMFRILKIRWKSCGVK